MNLDQLPKHIFGMHDQGAEPLFVAANKQGWIVLTARASDAPGNYSDLSNAGHAVIVRLNHGYGSDGTLPSPSRYSEFASACANHVAGSQGAHIWIIGNETNLEGERPGNSNGQGGDPITPDHYADCFALCRKAIKNVSGHADDWVIPSPPGPWNAQTSYPGNPGGDWVNYFRDILNECVSRGAPPDALALHTYTNHDVPMDTALISSEERTGGGRYWQFRAYRDFLGVVPAALRKLPVLITESQHLPWENRDMGWIQNAYAEINAWNANAANQPIQAFCLFRWQHNPGDPEGWGISDKNRLQQDFRAALQNEYPVRWAIKSSPSVTPPVVTPPVTGILPLAKARWFVEETIRQLEAGNGNAAHKLLSDTVIPWFYGSAPQHSDSLPNAQAHTTARWWCEEATRRIEAAKLSEAHDILRDQVLSWLNSSGPSAIGILGIEPAPAVKSKKKTTAKKPRAKKTKSMSSRAATPKKTKRARATKKSVPKSTRK